MSRKRRGHDDDDPGIPAKKGKRVHQQQTAQPVYTQEELNDPLFPAFNRMDLDSSGKLDAQELAHVLSRMRGVPVSETTANQLINEADKDGVYDLNIII